MADNYITAIKSIVDNINTTGSYGWSTYTQCSPNRKEWHNLPAVFIVPKSVDNVNWKSFCNRSADYNYQVVLVDHNELRSTHDSTGFNFVNDIMVNFDRTPSSLTSLSVYRTKVMPSESYDRSQFPLGFKVTCVELKLQTIISSAN